MDRQKGSEEAMDLIARAVFGHLATVTEDGHPYVIPVNHALRDGRIYVHSAPEGHKLQNIKRDGRVCFEVSELVEIVPGELPCRYAAKYRSAVAFGRATILERSDARLDALKAIAIKYTGKDGPFSPEDLERVAIVEITVESATFKARV